MMSGVYEKARNESRLRQVIGRHDILAASFMFAGLLLSANGARAVEAPPSWEYPPHQQTQGAFWREHWYERGEEHNNPAYEKRLRVNPPEVVLHEKFGVRVEARENGLMLIKAEEDLFQISGAELMLEMWGGHPGTAGKRLAVNGRRTYALPLLGTEDGHCTYSYPVVQLQRGDLVNGWNAMQLALDQGTTFWGHMMVDEACLRVALKPDHPELTNAGLANFSATVQTSASGDSRQLSLQFPPALAERIARVDYQAWHYGYDENGNRRETDWHGFTHNRVPGAYVGIADTPPFAVTWDTSLLPSQKNVAVRAFVRFRGAPDLVYVTAAVTALTIPDRARSVVALYTSHDLPQSFWSRANNKKTCHVKLDVSADRIERAELHVVAWTGGAGTVLNYFTLNGNLFPVAEGRAHVPVYSQLRVEPSLLKTGDNTIELLSDTEHHGIEICYPGPALMVRYRIEP